MCSTKPRAHAGREPGLHRLRGDSRGLASSFSGSYQILAVALLASASMTAFQDLQATTWRDVAIGEIPEIVVYRNPKGTFTRSVTAGLSSLRLSCPRPCQGDDLAVPYLRDRRLHADHGHGICHPPAHPPAPLPDAPAFWGALVRRLRGAPGVVFIGQIVGKWEEGGWVVLITFSLSDPRRARHLDFPGGLPRSRENPPHRPRKRRVAGFHGIDRRVAIPADAGIPVPFWSASARFFELFGVRRPLRFEAPVSAGDYNEAVHRRSSGSAVAFGTISRKQTAF